MALNAQKILQNFVIDFKIKKAKDELNYLNERVLENSKYYHKLHKILDLIALHIPMNLRMGTLKPSRVDSFNKATLKEVYKTRENFRNVLNNWVR